MGATYPSPSTGKGLIVSFGLVNVGVKYGPLVQDQRTKGHYVSPDDLGPVKQQYVNERTGEIVKPISAYDSPSGPVVLDAEEKAALESERDKRLNLQAFVELDSVDPLYFERTYLVWPEKGQEAGYDLLCAALASSGKALLGTSVLTKATATVLLRYGQGCLLMHVCTYDANVNWANHRLVTMGAGERPEPAPELVEMALSLFSSLPEEFDFSAVSDEYDERLRSAIAAKAEGRPIEKAPEAEPADVLDLMDALKASVAAVKAPKAEPKPKRSRTRKTAA